MTSGVAALSGEKYTKAETIYVKAVSGALTLACSTAVNVNPASASKLVFTSQPSTTATAGTIFAAQPTLVAQDVNNNVDTGYSVGITLTAYTDTGCTTTLTTGNAYPQDPTRAYRTMTVWVSTPLRAKTPLAFSAGSPAVPLHVEVALIAPGVVNVFPRTVYTR